MTIPTEPIGSLPRPPELLAALSAHSEELEHRQNHAVADTLARLEGAGCPVLVDGDQAKPDVLTYPLAGSAALAPDGAVIPYDDGHTRQLPRLTGGPFRYGLRAGTYVRAAKKRTDLPVKATVIAPSALSLLYPTEPLDGYSREAFLADLVDEAEADIRDALDAGAHSVQLDCGLARLTLKLDPSGGVLDHFIALDNSVLERFTREERARIGAHTYPGADQGSTHSLDIDYADLLPKLFQLKVGNFYLQLASEPDPERVLKVVAGHLRPDIRVFVGVTDPLDPRFETPEQVRDRVLAAARHIPVTQLGTCDDAGFATYADDSTLSRDTAFAKIEARVKGTELAATALGL
ncbi:5-methyltetrahydropteroyltriglutamate--homocysteine methyltransferase [Streptomyces eurythermus]